MPSAERTDSGWDRKAASSRSSSKPATRFDLDHWFTPPPINEGAYDIVAQKAEAIQFRKAMHLVNYSGTAFDSRPQPGNPDSRSGRGRRNGNPGPRRSPDGRLRLQQQDHQYGRNRLGERNRASVDLDPRHVQSLAGDDHRHPLHTRAGDGIRPIVTMRTSARSRRPADCPGERGVLFFSGDGKYRRQDRHPAAAGQTVRRSYDAEHKVLTVVHLTVPEGATTTSIPCGRSRMPPSPATSSTATMTGPPLPGQNRLGRFTRSSPRRRPPRSAGRNADPRPYNDPFPGPRKSARRDCPEGARCRHPGDRESLQIKGGGIERLLIGLMNKTIGAWYGYH